MKTNTETIKRSEITHDTPVTARSGYARSRLARVSDIVSDEELDDAYGHASFGDMTKREVVALAVLKCASGYYQGHTSKTIAMDLGLIDMDYELTDKGRSYLWVAWSNDRSF